MELFEGLFIYFFKKSITCEGNYNYFFFFAGFFTLSDGFLIGRACPLCSQRGLLLGMTKPNILPKVGMGYFLVNSLNFLGSVNSLDTFFSLPLMFS